MPVKGGHGPPPVLRPPFAGMALIFKEKHKTLLLVLFLIVSSSSGLSDSEILLKFKGSLSNDSAVANWSVNTLPCQGDLSHWSGVICVNGSVWGLQLERMGLMGTLEVQSLELISDLRTLSFMNNKFQGPMPVFNKLGSMRSLYLSNNHFSGQIPDDAFQGMLKLNKVYLADNEFSGPIPSSLANLPKLLELRLEGNNFSGNLPNFRDNFTSFNVSNNQLEGQIPDSLSKFDLTSFSGNKGLCGSPLSPCTSTLVPNSTNNASNYGSNSIKNSSNPSLASIIVVIIVAVVAVGAIIAAAFILINSRKQQQLPLSIETPPPSQLRIRKVFKDLPEQAPRVSPDASSASKKPEATKLSFVRDDIERFDLPDLLRASAEILGSGCFGSSYRAALTNGLVMVVKRFKQMNNVGKEEFHEHMRRLGRLRHPNLLPLVAYYYRKEEKLLITEFVENRSLANRLHGRHSEGQESLNWETRLKIVKGVAKGLRYLYKELPSIIAAHGHLKSSNILLNQSYEPIISDYGLVPVINQENAHELMAAYRSPEYLQLGRITRKTDVWSFGILILELLSGKFPSNFLTHGSKGNEEDDLANWVKSVPEEEWMNKVIEKDMRATKNNEGEIIKLLKIGLSCCEEDLDRRLDLKQVVERINEIKEKDNDDDIYSSSYASDGEEGQMILLSPE